MKLHFNKKVSKMMDVVELAKEAVVVLSPAIPYLTKGGGQALEEVSKKMTAAALEQAKALWGKITSRSEQSGNEIKKASNDVADNPSNPDAQAALRLQIKKLLSTDNELLTEIRHILQPSLVQDKGGNIFTDSTINAVNIVGGNQEIKEQKMEKFRFK
jgi:hypothetical protein